MPQKSTSKSRTFKPCNKGKAVGQKQPLTPEQVQLIKKSLEAGEEWRDLVLFSTAIDTMLRSIDLLRLKVDNVCDEEGKIVEEFTVLQQKTGDGTLVGLSDFTREKLDKWIRMSHKFPEDYLFTVLKGDRLKPLSRDYYRELVKKWVRYARLDPKMYSTHSLRRTKAALIYDRTRNIEVVRELLGQKTVTATSAYLNVGKKKALAIARRFEI